MSNPKFSATALAVGAAIFAGNVLAHDDDSEAGTPVCVESNIMVAGAMNTPFSNNPGFGRVLEMNIMTGERGITVDRPFTADADEDICNGTVSWSIGETNAILPESYRYQTAI